MRNTTQAVTMMALAMGLAACASKPETPPPEPVPPPPPVAAPAQPPVRSGPVAGSVEDFRVSVGERVFFDYDSYALDAEDRATLDKQAAWLQRYSAVRVRVAGHADERGTREYNLALGARRAAAVKDYLVSQGVAAGRIESVSYGKERPIDPRSTEEAWALNRRSETEIIGGAIS